MKHSIWASVGVVPVAAIYITSAGIVGWRILYRHYTGTTTVKEQPFVRHQKGLRRTNSETRADGAAG